MRTRHRIPTIFSLSMLDVFCCALGCVIFLWLWNDRLAKMRLKAAEDTKRQLESTLWDLSQARAKIDSLESDLTQTRGRLALTLSDLEQARGNVLALTRQRDQTAQELAAARTRLADSQRQIETLQKKTLDQERTAQSLLEQLAKKAMEERRLKDESALTQQRLSGLEVLLRNRDKELTVATARTKELTEQLHDLEAQLQMLRSKSQATLSEQEQKLAAAQARMQELEKFLNNRKSSLIEMQRQLDDLQSERKNLTDQLAKLRIAADNRFAGIQLTGRRVIFIVDMSGSMRMVDAQKESPEKWPLVISTVKKIMQSLPDLEKFQVVVFSEAAHFPLGSSDDWLNYDEQAADRVERALKGVEPRGNTNLYAAFEAAFRFRARGLDTIYLLSDGLPNVGPGLTPLEQTQNLNELQKGERLGRYIRNMLSTNWNRSATGWTKVRINSIGFFYESPDLGAFLWALARENEGNFVGMSQP
jgi:hypothetical protein